MRFKSPVIPPIDQNPSASIPVILVDKYSNRPGVRYSMNEQCKCCLESFPPQTRTCLSTTYTRIPWPLPPFPTTTPTLHPLPSSVCRQSPTFFSSSPRGKQTQNIHLEEHNNPPNPPQPPLSLGPALSSSGCLPAFTLLLHASDSVHPPPPTSTITGSFPSFPRF